jgi:XTP/dITP diphosphohydrolase
MTDRLPTVYLASRSRNKFNDYKFLLGNFADLQWYKLSVDEPQTPDLEIMIRRKINETRPFLPYLPFFVEQTGLIINIWHNLPGTATTMFMDSVGNMGICRMMAAYEGEERAATAVTYLGYHSPDGKVQIFKGAVAGHIAKEPRGDKGYGWDAIFVPQGQDKTFGEMTNKQKNEYATRILAATAFNTAVLKTPHAEEIAQNRVNFLETFIQSFSLDELDDLIFNLGLDPDEIAGRVKRERVRELILYFSRRQQMSDLLQLTRLVRPNVDWPEIV